MSHDAKTQVNPAEHHHAGTAQQPAPKEAKPAATQPAANAAKPAGRPERSQRTPRHRRAVHLARCLGGIEVDFRSRGPRNKPPTGSRSPPAAAPNPAAPVRTTARPAYRRLHRRQRVPLPGFRPELRGRDARTTGHGRGEAGDASRVQPAGRQCCNDRARRPPTPTRRRTPNANPQPNAIPQEANPQAANANRVAGGTPQPGETRTANYGEQHNAGNMQQKGFVLILRRESGQHLPGQGK